MPLGAISFVGVAVTSSACPQNVAATVDGNRLIDMDGGLQELLGRLMILTEDEAAIGSIFGVLSALPGTVGTLVEVWLPACGQHTPN